MYSVETLAGKEIFKEPTPAFAVKVPMLLYGGVPPVPLTVTNEDSPKHLIGVADAVDLKEPGSVTGATTTSGTTTTGTTTGGTTTGGIGAGAPGSLTVILVVALQPLASVTT